MISLTVLVHVFSNREDVTGQKLRSTVLNYGHVTAACFAPDGQRLLSAIGDGQIRVLTLTFALIFFFVTDNNVDECWQMFDVDSGKELHRFTGHNGAVLHLALSRDCRSFVSSSSDGTAKVWDLASVVSKIDGTQAPIYKRTIEISKSNLKKK